MSKEVKNGRKEDFAARGRKNGRVECPGFVVQWLASNWPGFWPRLTAARFLTVINDDRNIQGNHSVASYTGLRHLLSHGRGRSFKFSPPYHVKFSDNRALCWTGNTLIFVLESSVSKWCPSEAKVDGCNRNKFAGNPEGQTPQRPLRLRVINSGRFPGMGEGESMGDFGLIHLRAK